MRSGFRSAAAFVGSLGSVVVSLVAASLSGACIFFVDEGAGGEGGAGGGGTLLGSSTTATSSAGGGGVGGAGVCTAKLGLPQEGNHPNGSQLVISPGGPTGVDLFLLTTGLEVVALKTRAIEFVSARAADQFVNNALLSPYPNGRVLVANGSVTELSYSGDPILISNTWDGVTGVSEAAFVSGSRHGRLADGSLRRLDPPVHTIDSSGVVRLVDYGGALVWATKTADSGAIKRCAGAGCQLILASTLPALFNATNVDLGYSPVQQRYVVLLAYDSDASTLHTGTLPDIPGESDAALLTSFTPPGEAMLDIAVGGEELFVLTDKALHVCSMDSIASDEPCCDSAVVVGGLRIAAAEGVVVVQRFEGEYRLAAYQTAAAPGG